MPADPTTIPTCSIVAGAYTEPCPGSPAGLVCGVFTASTPSDSTLSRQYGLCMPADHCQHIASSLPGGYGCFNASAVLVAGS